jgi:hypothetical protein
MPLVPSIKGSVFAAVVENVHKLVTGGEISRTELARWLQPQDIDFLDQQIAVSEWYDIRVYARMSELLRDVVGKGSNEYLRQLGRQTAQRLLEAGLYQQLEYLSATQLEKATDSRARFEAFGRDLRLLTTLSASILNFSKWESKPDPGRDDRYVIRVSEARDVPEVLCWRSDGFVNEMATQHGEPDLWRWERMAPDLVVFRMIRSL